MSLVMCMLKPQSIKIQKIYHHFVITELLLYMIKLNIEPLYST